MPPSVPRLARHSGRAHRVAAAAGPRPQRRGPRTLCSGPTLPAQRRRQGGVPAVCPGALLSARALPPQPHLQLLRRAGLQRLGGGARRERLGHRKEPNTGTWSSFADLLRDLFRDCLSCLLPSLLPRWCSKRQLVDLVMEGVWQELLDSAQIEICVADWWGARENCGCVYQLRVRLLDVYEKEVVKFSASPDPVLQWTERGCRQVSHVFTNFGKGIRYVSFEQYGRDVSSWVGHYGALVTHSSVRVRIRLS
ncbi:PREDICTED: F-box only protein 17 isoform X2 [Colobus angolensis palliatus]|uniref:F-box only protein 17 isoform X2 n=1 Tax=Colobus angolensis palliatus TaxID=336983 RepID=UPI0005F3CBF3|nr:PREDICTED: F-box only protein 17 isoform X2 [Colobus angolensis palliatus]